MKAYSEKMVYSISIHSSDSVNFVTLSKSTHMYTYVVLGVILGPSPALLDEAGFLSRNQSSLTWLAPSQISTYPEWSWKPEATPISL